MYLIATLLPDLSCWHFFMNYGTCVCFRVLQFHFLHFHSLWFWVWRSVIFTSCIFSQPIVELLTSELLTGDQPHLSAQFCRRQVSCVFLAARGRPDCVETSSSWTPQTTGCRCVMTSSGHVTTGATTRLHLHQHVLHHSILTIFIRLQTVEHAKRT